jgi:predicted nucleic acid-binding protein
MRVLVDTPIWSLALRRRPPELSSEEGGLVADWAKIIEKKRIVLIGPVRQELLSGVRAAAAFDRLRDHLRAFQDEPLTCADYEEAARCFNVCRGAGITGSNVDFLICAAAIRRHLEIFTMDTDFRRYAKHLPIRLHETQVARR